MFSCPDHPPLTLFECVLFRTNSIPEDIWTILWKVIRLLYRGKNEHTVFVT